MQRKDEVVYIIKRVCVGAYCTYVVRNNSQWSAFWVISLNNLRQIICIQYTFLKLFYDQLKL